jgi:membrane protein YdbS with pleckstrin-like domain
MKPKKRSPIKAKPLRNPGQSLDEQRVDLAYDKVLGPFMVALFMVVLAGLEWWRYFHPAPFNPIVYSAFAVLFVLYAIWKIWRTLPTLR